MDKVCARTGCKRKVAKGRTKYCSEECSLAMKNERRRKPYKDLECALEGCHNPIPKNSRRKYCCNEHRIEAANARRRLPSMKERECPVCHEQFVPRSNTHTYCSDLCRDKSNRDSKPYGDISEPVKCKRCGEEFVREYGSQKYCDDCKGVAVTPDEEIKRQQQKSLEKKIRQGVGQLTLIFEKMEELSPVIDPNRVPHLRYYPKGTHDEETFVIVTSDEHWGAMTDGGYCLEYMNRSWDYYTERILRIHEIMSQTIPFKRCVHINDGDHLTGQGIFKNQAYKTECNVMEQYLLHCCPSRVRLYDKLLERFETIDSYYLRGNHGRTGFEYPDEVNWDTVMAYQLKTWYKDVERVNVNVIEDWYDVINIDGWGFLTTHGDMIRQYLNIPWYGQTTKASRWSLAIQEPWQYLLLAHFHTFSWYSWNKIEIICNGSFLIGDEFPLKVMGMAGEPVQWVFGVHPERGASWRYPLNVKVEV